MAVQADIPSDLNDSDNAHSFRFLDAELNSAILYALLHGIYTGILAVTLWTTCESGASTTISKLNGAVINKCWPIRRAPVIVIIVLHALITINFAANWSAICSAFIKNRQNWWTVSAKLAIVEAVFWETGIPALLSTILADLYVTWCCWMIWGRRWPFVLFPILSLISATTSKIMAVHSQYAGGGSGGFLMTYTSLVLATTLFCTLLIIYRILTVAGVSLRGAEGRFRVYRRFIGVLVESSVLYSVSMIPYLAFNICGDFRLYYFGVIASIAKGVVPTLLVGRAAAGYTRPNDDGDESTVSSLHFQTPSEVGTTSLQESIVPSAVLEMDIEAQPEQSDELVAVVERTQ